MKPAIQEAAGKTHAVRLLDSLSIACELRPRETGEPAAAGKDGQ
jgi:hypothetical protein